MSTHPEAQPRPPLDDGVVGLRPLREADAEWIAEAYTDPDILHYTATFPGITVGQIRDAIRSEREQGDPFGGQRMLIVDASTEAPLGSAGVGSINHATRIGEVFYWVAPKHRGRGVASRATAIAARWGFQALGLDRLELYAHVDNVASHAVARRVGFTREGIIRSARRINGQREDLVLFSLLPHEISDSQPKRGQ